MDPRLSRMRGSLVPLGALLVGTALLGACSRTGAVLDVEEPPAVETARPSVLLIVVDDWALSDLRAARSDANPWNDLLAIDSIEAAGQSWSNFYSQPTCNPTRATLMFGRYVAEGTGGTCTTANEATPDAKDTLAKMLGRQGYATAAFGKWHIGANPDENGRWQDVPGAYGFDAWRAWNASNVYNHCGSKSYTDWHRVDDGVGSRSSEYHTEAVGLAAADWWQTTEGPKFAYVAFQAPHEPMHTPPAHLLPSGYPTPTTAREQYDSMLVALDTMVATLLGIVDPRDTIVIVLGDNGTPPTAVRTDQRASRTKGTTWEDGVNVPLLVAGPGIERGTTDALGHVVDLYATLGELAGDESLAVGFEDSVSLVPVLHDGTRRVRDHVICDQLEYMEVSNTPIRDTAVVLAWEDPPGLLKGRFFVNVFRGFDRRHYFDLATDPTENDELAPDDPVFGEGLERIRAIKNEYLTR